MFGSYAHAQGLEIVADLNTTDYTDSGSEPDNFIEYDGTIYFIAESSEHGREVFKMEGDSAVIALDIAPGTASSLPRELAVWNGKLYITAYAHHNWQLFEYDPAAGSGTGTNLTMVTNFATPTGVWLPDYAPTAMVAFGNQLCFAGRDSIHGMELYTYDGSTVSMVADLNPGAAHGLSQYGTELMDFNGTLYFLGEGATGGSQLYQYDGSSISLAATINASGSSFPFDFVVGPSNLWFTAYNGTNSGVLYSWDGSALTSHYAELGAWAKIAGPVNGMMVSYAKDGTNEVLREYDDSSWSTILDFTPSSNNWYAELIAVTNNTLWFYADSGSVSEGLWTWDGTSASQVTVPTDVYYPAQMTYHNGITYMVAEAPSGYEELFRSDGNSIEIAQDLMAATEDGFASNGGTAVFGGQLYFAATTAATGQELYRYSGNGSPELVGEIAVGPTSSRVSHIFKWRNELYFSADTTGGDADLYKYDGTSITLVHSAHAAYDNFATLGNKLCMRTGTYQSGNGIEFSWYNGTTFTTLDLVPGIANNGNQNSSNPYGFIKYNNELYFTAEVDKGEELYKFDGNTVSLVADINPDTTFDGLHYHSQPLDKTVHNGLLYFSALPAANTGRELYSYDGTNITMHAGPSTGMNPQGVVEWNGKLYMGASTTAEGAELWSFDGSNFTLVSDHVPGTNGSSLKPLVGTCDHLYLTGANGLPYGLTTSDSLIAFDWFPTDPQHPSYLAIVGSIEFQGQIYCGALHPYLGLELARWNEGSSLENVHEYNVGDAAATLRWNAADIADEYQVQWRQAGVPGITLVSTGTTPELALSSLSASSVYWWRVRKRCNNSPRQWTEWQRFKTLATSCPQPTGLSTPLIAPAQQKAKIAWNASAAATVYHLRYRLIGASDWTYTTRGAGFTSKWLLNLQNDTTYEWGISSHCSSGLMLQEMPWSATQTFTLSSSNKQEGSLSAEALQAFHLAVFPNPNNGTFTVQLGAHEHPVTATLYDLSGRQVAQRMVGSDATSIQFDNNNLTSGVYVLQIASCDLVVRERIILR